MALLQHTHKSFVVIAATLALVFTQIAFPPGAAARQQYKPNLTVLDASIVQPLAKNAAPVLFITIRNTSGVVGAGSTVTTVQHDAGELFVDVPAIPRGHALTVELPLTTCATALTIFVDSSSRLDETSEADNLFEAAGCPALTNAAPSWNPEIFQ